MPMRTSLMPPTHSPPCGEAKRFDMRITTENPNMNKIIQNDLRISVWLWTAQVVGSEPPVGVTWRGLWRLRILMPMPTNLIWSLCLFLSPRTIVCFKRLWKRPFQAMRYYFFSFFLLVLFILYIYIVLRNFIFTLASWNFLKVLFSFNN